MRISGISLFLHDLKVVNGPYVYAGASHDVLTSVIVRISTETGQIGWGESCPLGATYAPAHATAAIETLKLVAPQMIGQLAAPRPVQQLMDAHINGQAYAKAVIDMALWDILGQATEQPVHLLLGGALRERIPSYFAVGIMPPEATREAVDAKVAEGYRSIQLKIGSGDIVKDAAALRAAWEAIPDGATLTADANRALTVADTMTLSRLTTDLPIAFEQPCASRAELRDLSGKTTHPIYWDEAAENVALTLDALAHGHAQGLGMKITRVGGLSPMCSIRDMAAARRIPISVDDHWGGDIIAAACVHMAATVTPALFRGTWLAQPYIDHHYDPAGAVRVENGWIDVPQRPGLGVSPDPALFGPPVFETSL